MTAGNEALRHQIGGEHYKKGIQPFQLSMANGHDGCIHAIQKYLTRHARVEPRKGYEALRKAHHICMVRVACMAAYGVPRATVPLLIEIGDYIRSNELDSLSANAVRLVEAWHNEIDIDHHSRAETIRATIRHLASDRYPQFFQREDFIA